MGNILRLTWISEQTDHASEERFEAALSDFEVIGLSIEELETVGNVESVLFHSPHIGNGLLEKIRIFRQTRPAATVLLLTHEDVPEAAVRTSGINHVLDGLEGMELLRVRLRQLLSRPTVVPKVRPAWRQSLIGESRPMQRVAEIIRLVGPRRCTVLITGETGTGKEVVARAIHEAGPRSDGPFVAINCSALPASLLESELFGSAKGAFTGAVQTRIGHFEQANGGTLFLDEIGELPPELQAKILRALQEREVRKLGSAEVVKLDVRVIAATNRDLRAKIRDGSFREDLFYRLNVVPMELPPLRVRGSDVNLLTEHFLRKICEEERIPPKKLAPEAWSCLLTYTWPGNVRQLENALQSAVILSGDQQYLVADDFRLETEEVSSKLPQMATIAVPDHGLDFTETINALERDLVRQALQKTNGNKTQAAEMLRLKRTTLTAKMRVLESESSPMVA